MRENSGFATNIHEIYVELFGNSQRYVNECCESESDGKIDGFAAGCSKRRGGVAVAVWCNDGWKTVEGRAMRKNVVWLIGFWYDDSRCLSPALGVVALLS
jgi:hypothetical protein